MKKQRNAALSFIFITLLIDITGWGLIIPVMPKLIEQLTGTDNSGAAEYGGFLAAIYSIIQFCFAPVLGNLSDKYGRRPILLFSLLGFGADYLFLFFSQNITWLIIGRCVAGITGASITTASAYIADISTSENRAQNFGIIGAAFGLGFIIGPALGGLLGSFGPRVPFAVAAGLCLLNALYGYFVLPESLSKDKRREFSWLRANPFGAVKFLFRYKGITVLVASLILIYIAGHAVQSNWSFFGIEKFGWTEAMIGISLSVVGLLVGGVQGGLIRIVNPWLGNIKSVYIGLILYALGLALFAFASQTWMMFVFLVPYCLGGIAGPALQSIISGHVPPNEQGELQGALTGLMSLTSFFGPLIMTKMFAAFTHKGAPIYFPGAPFLLGAVLMLISTLIAYLALRNQQETLPVKPAA